MYKIEVLKVAAKESMTYYIFLFVFSGGFYPFTIEGISMMYASFMSVLFGLVIWSLCFVGVLGVHRLMLRNVVKRDVFLDKSITEQGKDIASLFGR